MTEPFGTSPYDAALDDAEPEAPEANEEPLDAETYGLIYRGHLSDTVKVGAHEIRIRTLRIGEELEAALLAKKYVDTVDAARAMATALVAASVESVDGKPLVQGLGPKEETVEAKFDYINKNWYWVTVQQVFNKYDDLLKKTLDRYETVKKD